MRRPNVHEGPAVYLLAECTTAVAHDHARDRLHEDAVFVRNLLGAPHEDSARLVHDMRLHTHSNEAHDLFLQHLTVAGAIFVPDHEVDCESLKPPIGMRLHELAHEI